MALPFARPARRGAVGLDLDGSFIAAVELNGFTVERMASRELPSGLIVDGEVSDAAGLSAVLKDFFKTHKLPRTVRIGVANQQIVVRQLELPRIDDPRERAAAVRFQAAEAIAMPLEEAVLDFQPIGESVSAEGAVRTRFIVVAARAAMVDRLVEAVRGAGLKPAGIDLNAFALVRCLTRGSGDEAVRVLCHFGGVSNLAVAAGTACVFTRPLRTVALAPGRDEAGAADREPEPLDTPTPPPSAAAETEAPAYFSPASPAGAAVTAPAASDRASEGGPVRELAEEIRLSIDFYMAQPDARWVSEVVLSGPGAGRPELAEGLREAIGLPVSVAAPLGALELPVLMPGEDPARYTVAAGLALGASA